MISSSGMLQREFEIFFYHPQRGTQPKKLTRKYFYEQTKHVCFAVTPGFTVLRQVGMSCSSCLASCISRSPFQLLL